MTSRFHPDRSRERTDRFPVHGPGQILEDVTRPSHTEGEDSIMAARDHELLQAAKRVAASLGFAPDEVMRHVVELGRGDRADWGSGELLLFALDRLTTERPPPPGTGRRAEKIEDVEAPRLGVVPAGRRRGRGPVSADAPGDGLGAGGG